MHRMGASPNAWPLQGADWQSLPQRSEHMLVRLIWAMAVNASSSKMGGTRVLSSMNELSKL